MTFYCFLTWMVFECLPNCNDYTQTYNKLTVTGCRRNKNGCHCHGAAVFSVSWAANFTHFVIAIKHAALL